MFKVFRFRVGVLCLVVLGLCLMAAPSWAKVKVGEYYPIDIETPWQYAGAGVDKVAWQYELSHPGATYLALHFTDFELAAGDRLVISDGSGKQRHVLHGRGKMGAGTFWARHVDGDTIRLSLETVNPNGGQGFRINQYAAGFVDLAKISGDTEAICGVDDKENAVCYADSHPTEYDRGRAVARLLINGSGLCTGWLVSGDDHLLTNEHCITSASDALNTDYEFMAEAPNCSDSNCQLCHPGTVFSGATFIQDNADLDYCLVQVSSGNPAATYGYLELDNRTAVVGEEIYILQHPGGRAKEFGIYSSDANDPGGICQVNTITADPCSGTGYNDVGYYCDTEGGSSGSPVLARSSHQVIALHHCANCPNRGVPINLIYPEIADIIISTGLRVTPGSGLDSAGDPGGPFSPDSAVYTLENLNATPIDYSVTKGQAWVSLSDTGGTLAGGATTTVTVSINSNANSLAAGLYTDTVNFINLTDHDGDTTREVKLTVGTPSVIYEWTMDSDPGWSTEGLWAFGQPTGGGGQYGGPDPSGGYTGTNVYGYNLNGDYENSLTEQHLTSGAINCTGLSAVTLKFARWLGVEQPSYDHAYVRVSTDGSAWTTVWENAATIAEEAWSLQELDISAIADNQSTLYLRWTMGTTDGSWQYCGWNIDDVQIVAFGDTGCSVPADCDDGLYCNGVEDCVANTCQAGTPVVCDDGVACTTDSCNEATDSCDFVPDDAACDNGLFCDGPETCDAVVGCQAGTAVNCNDGVACTDDSCNETDDVCDNVPDDAYCDDDLFCTGVETCDVALGCQEGSDPCPGQLCDEPTNQCYGGSCNNNGICESGEDCNSCPNDCMSGLSGCGNGVCEPSLGEDCLSCADDCNGTQGGKPSGRFCCGDGDGVNPVGCSDGRCTGGGYACSDTPAPGSCCGDSVCEGLEDSCSCSLDCGLPPTNEVPGSTCADGFDNDCDGLTDAADPDCPCGTSGDACTDGAQCCSGKCKKGFCS